MTHAGRGSGESLLCLGGGRGVGRVWRRWDGSSASRRPRPACRRRRRPSRTPRPTSRTSRRRSAARARPTSRALDRYGDVLTETAPTVGDVRDAGSRPGASRRRMSWPGAEAAVDGAAGRRRRRAGAGARPRRRWRRRRSPVRRPRALRPPPAARSRWRRRPRSTASSRPRRSSAPSSRASPTRPRCRRPRSSSTPPPSPWRCRGCGCSPTPAASPTSSRSRPRRRCATTPRRCRQSLRDAGYYDGEVDGVYGPATVDAVEALQKAHGLPITGTVDKATAAALAGRPGGQGRGHRPGGGGVDGRGAADAQARRASGTVRSTASGRPR